MVRASERTQQAAQRVQGAVWRDGLRRHREEGDLPEAGSALRAEAILTGEEVLPTTTRWS